MLHTNKLTRSLKIYFYKDSLVIEVRKYILKVKEAHEARG